jgi:nucleoside-diphosphate-sugar epimerase
MRVLVTGSAGFIGSRVSERLLDDGHAVVGVDNLNHAYDVRLKEWRLTQLQQKDRFAFVKTDIADRRALAEVFAGDPFDAVINLAARAGVRDSLQDPWTYYDTNVTGTLNVLEMCRQRGGAGKLVLASTSSVYGDGQRPFREDLPADRVLSPYAASKKAAEELCYAYHHLYGLDVTVLRYFTVYGPAGRPDMSVFRWVRGIAEGQTLTQYGDGSQERDFTYVDDIARGTVLALKPLGYDVINLGSDRPVALNRITQLVEGYLEKKAVLQRAERHPADVQATWADIAKARSLLGWEPRVSLEDGLDQTVRWYLAHRSWASAIA